MILYSWNLKLVRAWRLKCVIVTYWVFFSDRNSCRMQANLLIATDIRTTSLRIHLDEIWASVTTSNSCRVVYARVKY